MFFLPIQNCISQQYSYLENLLIFKKLSFLEKFIFPIMN